MTWFVVFALSAFGVWYWRHYTVQQRDLESSSSPQRMGERFIGRVVTVPKGIENGEGRVQLGPQKWSLRGPDVPAGGKVRITGVDGRVLIVDRLPSR
jgi:membrane protein implicated in regulation of membrane protease activity